MSFARQTPSLTPGPRPPDLRQVHVAPFLDTGVAETPAMTWLYAAVGSSGVEEIPMESAVVHGLLQPSSLEVGGKSTWTPRNRERFNRGTVGPGPLRHRSSA